MACPRDLCSNWLLSDLLFEIPLHYHIPVIRVRCRHSEGRQDTTVIQPSDKYNNPTAYCFASSGFDSSSSFYFISLRSPNPSKVLSRLKKKQVASWRNVTCERKNGKLFLHFIASQKLEGNTPWLDSKSGCEGRLSKNPDFIAGCCLPAAEQSCSGQGKAPQPLCCDCGSTGTPEHPPGVRLVAATQLFLKQTLQAKLPFQIIALRFGHWRRGMAGEQCVCMCGCPSTKSP